MVYLFYVDKNNDYANGRDYGILSYNKDYILIKNKIQYINISLRSYGNVFKPKSMEYKFIGAKKYQVKLERFYNSK